MTECPKPEARRFLEIMMLDKKARCEVMMKGVVAGTNGEYHRAVLQLGEEPGEETVLIGVLLTRVDWICTVSPEEETQQDPE